ncbi:DUF1254 domain-containing protein [Cupriavidus numazuensis]|uniref:DUF1254 domain-containing protein n=1 Tax=Cupriavidus numazuensis TaxID=221992 RepID=A0ABM8TLL0_9BURK|nr:DUF1254 domain-containing protein [Cupriavidus numazuensis]CAG2153815.1 hypothetical protein LMG26411_04472 [Cupriavidus numazuensis]
MIRAFLFLSVAFLSAIPGYAQSRTSGELSRRVLERRAIEAINWGMPAVNYDVMLQAMIGSAKGRPNQVLYWSGLPGWRNQTLTPNPDVIYAMPFFNTTDVGPMVLEIPPADGGSITGTIMDGWQSALEDVGPAGVDKGKGGKYLILPPGYEGAIPEGYIALPSMTYQGYALLRSNPESASEADVAKAVAYARRVRFYPLSLAGTEPRTIFVDAMDVVFDATIPYDIRFFESLNRIVQAEPWLSRDKVMIDMLKSIGIEKGKPFEPDAATREVLNSAAGEARQWLDERHESGFPRFYDRHQWTIPASPELAKTFATFYEAPNVYSVDGRGLFGTYAFSSIKHRGVGQFYLMSTKDGDGHALDGGRSYRLRVPANVPVRLYWSAALYDRATHAPIRHAKVVSRSSLSLGLQKNSDGSVDIYFGPVAPKGKEGNWAPTSSAGRFEVIFRFFGPEKSLLDKTWVLPDIEKVN